MAQISAQMMQNLLDLYLGCDEILGAFGEQYVGIGVGVNMDENSSASIGVLVDYVELSVGALVSA